jgi:hypothetical protein
MFLTRHGVTVSPIQVDCNRRRVARIAEFAAAAGSADTGRSIPSRSAKMNHRFTAALAYTSADEMAIVRDAFNPDGKREAFLALLSSACDSCDANCDGAGNSLDIEPFVNCLLP